MLYADKHQRLRGERCNGDVFPLVIRWSVCHFTVGVWSDERSERELHWREILDRQAESDLSVRKFCATEGISEPSFYAWRKKLVDRSNDKEPQQQPTPREDGPDNGRLFVPMKLLDAHQTLEIIHPLGYRIQVTGDVNPVALRHVIGVLDERSAPMIALPPQIRVFLYGLPTDMRKSFNGLVALTESALKQDPLSGSLFVFVNRRRDRIKILYWGQTGFCIWYQQLQKGTYQLPDRGIAARTGDDRSHSSSVVVDSRRNRSLFRSSAHAFSVAKRTSRLRANRHAADVQPTSLCDFRRVSATLDVFQGRIFLEYWESDCAISFHLHNAIIVFRSHVPIDRQSGTSDDFASPRITR